MSQSDIGRKCIANDAKGHLRFLGNTKFAAGTWAGVELLHPQGKNDGSVQGHRYFSCQAGHGVFVRPTKLVFLDKVNDGEGALANEQIKSRDGAAVFKVSRSTRETLPKTPSRLSRPASRTSPAGSVSCVVPGQLARPDSKRQFSNTTSISDDSGQRTILTSLRKPSESPKPILGASVRVAEGLQGPTRRSISSTSDSSSRMQRHSSNQSATGATFESTMVENTLELPHDDSVRADILLEMSPVIAQDTITLQTPKPDQSYHSIEVETLRAKLVDLEIQRTNDFRRLSSLGALEAEKQAWANIKSKLREKLQSQQLDIKSLRDRVKSLEEELNKASVAARTENDMFGDDSRDALEMAMLDREMAEEQRDQLQVELHEALARNNELVLELEIYKESKELADEQSVQLSGADTRAITQQNERLREALIRLKEVSNDQEERLNASLNEHEALRVTNADLSVQMENLNFQLEGMSLTVDDLKEQLELQVGAEEMLEALTERNLSLGEQLEICKAEINDLETLRALNDELDADHLLARKELEQEVQQQSSMIHAQATRLKEAEISLSKYASTVDRFQDFIRLLQSEIKEMKRQGQEAVNETAKVSSQATDLLAKNMDLQRRERQAVLSSTDNDLRSIDIAIAIKHLDIILDYMPKTYENDKTAVESYLALLRLESLLELVLKLTSEELRIVQFEMRAWLFRTLLAIFEARYWTHSLLAAMRHSSSDDFTSFGQHLQSITQYVTLLHAHIKEIGTGRDSKQTVLASLCSICSAIDDMAKKFSDKPGGDLVASCALISGSVELCAQAIRYLVERAAPNTGSEVKISSSNASPPQMNDHSSDQHVTSIKSLCSQIIRHDAEMSLKWSASSLSKDTCLPDLMSKVLTISRTIERGLKADESEEVINSDEPLAETKSQCIASFAEVHKSLEILFTQVAVPNTMLKSLSPTPWKMRAYQLHQETDLSSKDEQQLKLTKQELKHLALQLQKVEKAYAEEIVRSQSLERRLKERDDSLEKLQELQNNDAQVLAETHSFETTIRHLNKKIARLESNKVEHASPHTKMSLAPDRLPKGMDVKTEEIRILRSTVRHLLTEAKNSQLSSTTDTEFLTRPLFVIPKRAKPAGGETLHKAIQEFSRDLNLVNFATHPPAHLKWSSWERKPGYTHYSQEEQYAKLLALRNIV